MSDGDDTSLGAMAFAAANLATDASGDFSASLGVRVDRIYTLYYQKLEEFYARRFNAAAIFAGAQLSSDFGARFHKFAKPDPNAATMAMQGFSEAHTALTRNLGTVEAIGDAIAEGWDAEAADNFQYYLDETKSAVALQRDALSALQTIQQQHQKTVTAVRRDILMIADNTIDALAAAEKDSAGIGVQGVLSVVAAAAGIVAALPSGGTSLTISAAVVAGMTGAAASMAPREAAIGGADPIEIIESTQSALTELEEAAEDTRKVIESGIKAAGEKMQEQVSTKSGEGARLAIRPPMPNIARGMP